MTRFRKILMTGATGFLGSTLLRSLVPRNSVAIITRPSSNLGRINDLSGLYENYVLDEGSIDDIIHSFRPEIVIHCATDYGRKAVPQMQVIEANLILPLQLIHAAHQYGVKMFVNTDTFLDKGVNYYSLSKRQFNDWFKTYQQDMICVNMVLEHFYGPFDDKTKFVSFVIHELLNNSPELKLTSGIQKRNFIFIDDVVRAFNTVLNYDFRSSNGFFDFFIASEQTISIRDLVEKLKMLCSNETTFLNFGALPFRANEVMDSSVDISKIKSLGWIPSVGLNEGLMLTIAEEKRNNSNL